jgi:hypothetical protein
MFRPKLVDKFNHIEREAWQRKFSHLPKDMNRQARPPSQPRVPDPCPLAHKTKCAAAGSGRKSARIRAPRFAPTNFNPFGSPISRDNPLAVPNIENKWRPEQDGQFGLPTPRCRTRTEMKWRRKQVDLARLMAPIRFFQVFFIKRHLLLSAKLFRLFRVTGHRGIRDDLWCTAGLRRFQRRTIIRW